LAAGGVSGGEARVLLAFGSDFCAWIVRQKTILIFWSMKADIVE
jgi:hypothetical protein